MAEPWYRRLLRTEQKAPEPAIPARPDGAKQRYTHDGQPITEFPPAVVSLLSLYGMRGSHAALYRSQPEARTVVDFISNEIASLGLHMYEKVPGAKNEPMTRLSLDEHDMALLLHRPSPGWGHHRLWTAISRDILIYDVAYIGKVRSVGGTVKALIRIPPTGLYPYRDPFTQAIKYYVTAHTNKRIEIDDLIIFYGYDPETNSDQTPPMETLRRILAEAWASGRYRENMWKNAARPEGVIERPLEAPDWGDEQREGFLSDWEAAMTGEANSGKTAILEEGMKWQQAQFNSRDMEYLQVRKLSRMECAAAWGIDPVMVGARDRPPNAADRTTFYVDRLVPFTRRLEEAICLQLIPEFEPFDEYYRVYVEFNIEEKMKGSFTEQAAVMATTVGGPILKVNEARAALNLPPVEGGDELFVPLNSVRGGGPQASPQNPVETPAEGVEPAGTTPGEGTAARQARLDAVKNATPKFTEVFERTFGRQSRTTRVLHGDWDENRWNEELSEDLIKAAQRFGDPSMELKARLTDFARKVNERTRATWNPEVGLVPGKPESFGEAAAEIAMSELFTYEEAAPANPIITYQIVVPGGGGNQNGWYSATPSNTA